MYVEGWAVDLLFVYLEKHTKLERNEAEKISIRDENLLFAHIELRMTMQSVFVKVKTFNRPLKIKFRERARRLGFQFLAWQTA